MVRLAGKLGFVECNRVAGIYEKDGIVYDEVTYRLK